VNCVVHTKTYDSLTSMWSSILCSKDLEFHNRGYIMGECNMCGIQLLKMCPTKSCTNKKTQWCNIGQQVVGTNVNGQEKKATRVMYNDTTYCVD
jgi:hypothetical protein